MQIPILQAMIENNMSDVNSPDHVISRLKSHFKFYSESEGTSGTVYRFFDSLDETETPRQFVKYHDNILEIYGIDNTDDILRVLEWI